MQTENAGISIKPNLSTQDKNSQNTKRAAGTLNIRILFIVLLKLGLQAFFFGNVSACVTETLNVKKKLELWGESNGDF